MFVVVLANFLLLIDKEIKVELLSKIESKYADEVLSHCTRLFFLLGHKKVQFFLAVHGTGFSSAPRNHCL